MNTPTCKLCGEPMPAGEEMFFYHGFSGPCPKPPILQSPPEPCMTSERQDVNRQCLAESLQTLAHAIDESYAPDVLAAMNEAYRHLTIAMTLYDNPLRATPRAVPDETLTVDAAKANAIAVRLSAFARELGRDHPRYITLLNAILVIEARTAHPPRAGEVTEEMHNGRRVGKTYHDGAWVCGCGGEGGIHPGKSEVCFECGFCSPYVADGRTS